MNDNKLEIFVNRLSKIGIDIILAANIPWIYIIKINGKPVTEVFQGNHGFTVAFLPAQRGKDLFFNDIAETFKLIRKYICN